MSTTIQIRHVPEPIHRTLKSRAAQQGMSLSDCVLEELRLIAERPSTAELRARLESRSPVRPRESFATLVRRERDSR
jgi:plasmid stability protein